MKFVFLAFFVVWVAVCAAQGIPGTVLLDSYPGSTDDAKLTAALADVQTRPLIPAIVLSNRTYTFTQTRQAFSGLKIIGPPAGYFDSELASAKYNSVKVVLNVGSGANSWMVGSGSIYNVYIASIGFTSSNGVSQFWHQPLPGTLYACTFDTLGFFGFKSVFGGTNDKAAVTQVNFKGQWTVLATYDTQFNLGGSDCEFWTSGYLNIGPGSGSAFAGNGRYLMIFDTLSKTNVGPIYVTTNNGWAGILASGNSLALSFTGGRYEGMNAGNPSYGAVITQKGGKVIWRDTWVGYGMTNPSANGHSPADQGMIMVTGGQALFDGLTYDRANGVAQTVPLIYASGAALRVRNAFTGATGGWSALPIVKNGGSGATFSLDDTVTLQ